ncbi:putative zinc alcohol dehydrogenase [Aspergillus sclerotioniger CBS 115572]|uniref:Putative zinc alcohol dehydrogenase n=1 Tax=Aspergillus sclerotioniger CBS 115572 TaxID=1450535 RepID=A0A317VGU0_9EURO|nr:putative zinc alcohol dehydrogenase [Aspergillus sclerotioniger CBS 115572]PWY72152.1 putative zinc alcohol dehydrogenase [Aspergillus sclerotioniger CBS 115572]
MSLMSGWQYATATGDLEKRLCLKTDLPQPSAENLSPNEVLVESLYVSLNPADYKIAELGLLTKFAIGLPATPGYDFYGRVKAVYPSNQDLKLGDLVFGSLGSPKQHGTLSQYFIAPMSSCVRVPDGVSPEEAASITSAAMAAYKALAPFIKTGQKVFINGGSGGVGIFAIQIAKILGAEVTTSCSTRNIEFCQGLGAQVIDYTQGNLIDLHRENGQTFDHIVDKIGDTPDLYRFAHLITKPEAKVAQIGAPATVSGLIGLLHTLYNKSVPSFLGGAQRRHVFIVGSPNREDLILLGNWVAEGKITINIDAKFSFEDTPKAFEKLKTGRTRGKIVIAVTESS